MKTLNLYKAKKTNSLKQLDTGKNAIENLLKQWNKASHKVKFQTFKNMAF